MDHHTHSRQSRCKLETLSMNGMMRVRKTLILLCALLLSLVHELPDDAVLARKVALPISHV